MTNSRLGKVVLSHVAVFIRDFSARLESPALSSSLVLVFYSLDGFSFDL